MSRPIDSNVSWYNFICKSGYVPVICGGNVRCSWPLTEDFSRTMLLLHWPNWRTIQDIKPDSVSWSEKMSSFLLMPECPNFVKADVQRAMIPTELQVNHDDSDNDRDQDPDDMQPEWLELVRPNTEFKEDGTDFNYNDGGLEYDWSQCSHDYPSDYGKTFLDNVNSKENTTDSQGLDLPDVNIDTLNTEQRLAFDIVMNTLFQFTSSSEQYTPLRLIVAGTAGSGKSYLIKCLVRAVRLLFQCNKCVQVLCPTGNAANLISGVTIHSFF